MNKIYVIIPLLLTLAFGGVYLMHRKDAAVKAEIAKVEAERAAAEEAAKKAEAERQARADADKRTAERLAEEKRKEDEKRAKWEAAGKQIVDDTAAYQAQAEKNAAEIKAQEAKLAALRAEKDQASQTVFDAVKEVEAARIAKRNAELEIQRLVEMTARKAGTTLGAVAATP
jgi:hypothetical protein